MVLCALLFLPCTCVLVSRCSKLGWFVPRHVADERRRLLDSCLNTRLLSNYVSSSSSLAGELSSNQV